MVPSNEPDNVRQNEPKTIPARDAWLYAYGYALPWYRRLWLRFVFWWRRRRR